MDQLRRNLGVEADAALGDERQIALLPDDDQCAGLRIGHFAAGHHQRLQIGFGYLRAVVENARNEIEPLLAHADLLQEPAYFGLENHDQRDGTDADDVPQDRRQQLHVERLDDHPQQINDDDARNDVGGVRSLGGTVYPIHDIRHEQNVDQIDECKRYESHNCKRALNYDDKNKKKYRLPAGRRYFIAPINARVGRRPSTPYRPSCRQRTTR